MSEARTSIATSVSELSAAPANEALLKANFQKAYSRASQSFLLDVSFEARPGFTILFGASGAGKTTLLDCIAGLAHPDQGRISVGNRYVVHSGQRINLPPAKRRIGYLFQTLALFPHMTVEQNVGYGLHKSDDAQKHQRVARILHSFRISHLAKRRPSEISGGEGQRAALARTLVTDPEVLLLDEPLAALDGPTKAHVMDDLRLWNQQHIIPILYVTHSREEVFALGERVLVLEAGRIVGDGRPHEVMSAPQQESVAQLAGFENIFDAVVREVHPERGTMTCGIDGRGYGREPIILETPLVRGGIGSKFRVGIRAGDILLATAPPVGLSARNVIRGMLCSLSQRDVRVTARVNCGVEIDVHLTLAARDALDLRPGREVWLVIKTHSCHLMQG